MLLLEAPRRGRNCRGVWRSIETIDFGEKKSEIRSSEGLFYNSLRRLIKKNQMFVQRIGPSGEPEWVVINEEDDDNGDAGKTERERKSPATPPPPPCRPIPPAPPQSPGPARPAEGRARAVLIFR